LLTIFIHTLASVVGEAKIAFELNSDLLSILELEPEEAEDDVQIPDHKVERTFPISQVAAIIAAGKFFLKTLFDQIMTPQMSSLPGPFYHCCRRAHGR